MKRAIVTIIVLVLAMSIALPIYANPKDPADSNGLDKGNDAVYHLYLYQKDTSTWEILEEGAWGKLTFNADKDSFVFNGHDLTTGTGYTLVNVVSGSNIDALGSGVVGEYGDINIKGDFDNWSGKFWLVTSSAVNSNNTLNWSNMAMWLWEYDVIDI